MKIGITMAIKPVAKVKSGVNNPIVDKSIYGIVKLKADSKDEYRVHTKDGNNYGITSKSYDNRGKEIIYSRYIKDGRYYKIIRTANDSVHPMPQSHYLPFKPELHVKGNLVIHDGRTMFDITEYMHL